MEFVGAGRTLTETDLSMSSMLGGDWHPIHSDEIYARSRGLKGRLFHGAFGLFIAITAMGAHRLDRHPLRKLWGRRGAQDYPLEQLTIHISGCYYFALISGGFSRISDH